MNMNMNNINMNMHSNFDVGLKQSIKCLDLKLNYVII